ncbi:hypothetical protein [Aquisalimonas asiatica]|uniref:Uncharacterized protein n=1 Tax=Aquisalimonas asiatica TaxID=406100 RepID=A0A1H8TK17_9GAMM|nr:hypothetical protein [Aquisalimonas asiatica]SEO90838.1 hypothetical protein SAMN04488052_104227 [Aquisalimonas asiatica]
MDAINYATLHLSDNDCAVLRSLINLLQADGRMSWQEVPAEDAQLVFLDVDAAPEGTWESAPAETLVWCSRTPSEQAEYTLQLPVKLKTLRPVFARLDAELTGQETSRQAGSAGDASGDDGESRDIFSSVRGL